jgi:hypothetical protein
LSVQLTILNGMVAYLKTLTWTGSGAIGTIQPANIMVRALPVAEQGLEVLPAICVCPGETGQGEKVDQLRMGSHGEVKVTYRIQLGIVINDNSGWDQNLPLYLTWREQLRKAFQDWQNVINGVPPVWQTWVLPREVIDRAKLNQNYGYIVVAVDVITNEPRGTH